jgi:hypothetical protein
MRTGEGSFMADILEKARSGTARVFKKSEEIATVTYALRLCQKRINDVICERDIDGTISPVSHSLRRQYESRELMTLVFEDRRKLDFYLMSPQTGAIQPIGSIY